MSAYADLIREELARQGRIGVSPAYVEAWMRVEHPTLDGLDTVQFAHEVLAAVECVDAAAEDISRRLAKSYGLTGF